MISSTNENHHEDILFCLTFVVSVVFDFTLGGPPSEILQRKKTFTKPQIKTVV